ncbi:MAG TPA: class I SAM-dependent methyltransferase [Gemmatimonas sp.]
MKTSEARALIAATPIGSRDPRRWIDLGCGSGTFTVALAELLPAGSHILAVDQDAAALRGIPPRHSDVTISTRVADATSLDLEPVDGVLMANVLHFVADQPALLARLAMITPTVVLVEYDRTKPHPPWVPYPVPRDWAVELFRQAGFTTANALGTKASRYGPDPLYAVSFEQWSSAEAQPLSSQR